ncbi:hypothetical protein [Sphingomonas echinoides]|uniref:hypothetical protein n=1 Tax=Sphingomonas echinoides TaxID=59803 RepID=UPI0024137FBB|nr:hypothetical protein [Sphingomonas echinoides]
MGISAVEPDTVTAEQSATTAPTAIDVLEVDATGWAWSADGDPLSVITTAAMITFHSIFIGSSSW